MNIFHFPIHKNRSNYILVLVRHITAMQTSTYNNFSYRHTHIHCKRNVLFLSLVLIAGIHMSKVLIVQCVAAQPTVWILKIYILKKEEERRKCIETLFKSWIQFCGSLIFWYILTGYNKKVYIEGKAKFSLDFISVDDVQLLTIQHNLALRHFFFVYFF